VNSRRRGDHRIRKNAIRLTRYQPPPFEEALRVHRQNSIGKDEPLCPFLNLARLFRILPPRPFNARLYFAKRDRGEKDRSFGKPPTHCSTAPCGFDFRNSETTLVSRRNLVN
jgi:hypothetical protein